VKKQDKERVVAELTERLRRTETLLVADYRGLTMHQIDELRAKLIEYGARFAVVKNTLTRRAAQAVGSDALLAIIEGPTAIAFLESDGDPVAVAKALVDAARDTRVLEVKGGLLEGRPIEAGEIESLAKLPPADILRSQVLGAITSPLTTIVGLFTAPLQDLYGLLDARIEQLGGLSGTEPQALEDAAASTEEASVPIEEAPSAGASGSEPQSQSPPEEAGETETTTEPETQEEEQ